MSRDNDFYVVSLKNNKRFNIRFQICLSLSVVVVMVFWLFTETIITLRLFNINIGEYVSYISIVAMIYAIYRVWKWYVKNKNGKSPYPSADKLLYFIQANNLYETDYLEKRNRDHHAVREKYISNSVYLGCYENENDLIIRAYKNADTFTNKMNDLDTGLSALFGLSVDNKIDTITHCDYYFKKIVLSTQQPNANNIPTELRDNLSVRLAMGNMSNEYYRMVFGEADGLQTINTLGVDISI